MARYKPQDRNSLLLPVVLSEQIVPGSFAFALNYLVDHELDLSALDAQFKNDEVGASACDLRVMLKIVLLAYSQGLISSRAIEQIPALSPRPKTRPAPVSACARPLIHPEAGSSTASALARWSRCLATSGTTSA